MSTTTRKPFGDSSFVKIAIGRRRRIGRPLGQPWLRACHVCSLYEAFFAKEYARAANLLSFVSFFVRSQSPFLRPDPRFADVVARRSCQGRPPRAPRGMHRACHAIP